MTTTCTATVTGRVSEAAWDIHNDTKTPVAGRKRELILELDSFPAHWPEKMPLRIFFHQNAERVALNNACIYSLPEVGDTVTARISWESPVDPEVKPLCFGAHVKKLTVLNQAYKR